MSERSDMAISDDQEWLVRRDHIEDVYHVYHVYWLQGLDYFHYTSSPDTERNADEVLTAFLEGVWP